MLEVITTGGCYSTPSNIATVLPAPAVAQATSVDALASVRGAQTGSALCAAPPQDNSMLVAVSMEGPVSLPRAGTDLTTAVAPESGLISVEDVIAFGGVPNPMGPDRRSSQRVQSQPDVDDLQIGRAMRMAKMKEVQNSTWFA
ncbi:aconitate cytoplasmic [Hordeum vulgare]|nr:aconitate cytoplasmic [Hordeum vulgare]